ncbi:MAG: DUF21 domain-containing protein, partial [Chitinivibrionia bacterium]|nr:DUF21 domain-containing protein [Chitinivibrionia bacterium]
MDILISHIVFILILLCFSAFFSGSEAALFSLSRAQTRRMADSGTAGKLVARMLARPRELLITILLGNLLVNVLATSMATALSIEVFGDKGVGYAFLAMSAVVIAFGEIFPKVIALHKAEAVSKAVVFPLRFFHGLFMPLWFLLARIADGAVSAIKRRLGHHKKVFSSDELLTAVNIGLREGDLDEFEHGVLSNILSFRETVVREIMTPSIDVFSLPLTMSREELADSIRKNTFSRIPLYGDTADDIRGILHVKDLMRILHAPADADIGPFLRHPFYIPESARISELFKD